MDPRPTETPVSGDSPAPKKRRLRARFAYLAYLLILRAELPFFMPIRRKLVNVMLGRRHIGLMVYPDVYISDYRNIVLGDHVSINRGSHLSGAGGITIGNKVAIGHATTILSSEHGFKDPSIPICDQPLTLSPVEIGDDVWLGARVCILAGVKISNGTVVAAGAVVTKSTAGEGSIIGGVPARLLKHRSE